MNADKIVKRRRPMSDHRIADIRIRCDDGRPIRRIDMKYLLEQLAERDKEIERLREAQKQAASVLQKIDWVGSGAKGLIDDAVEILLPAAPEKGVEK